MRPDPNSPNPQFPGQGQAPNPYGSTQYGGPTPAPRQGGNDPYSNPPYGPNAYPPNPYGQPGATPPPPPYSNNQYGQPTPPPYQPGQQYPPQPNSGVPNLPPSYQPPPAKKRSNTGVIVLVALAILVVIAGIVAAIAIPARNNQIAQDATATAQTNATQTKATGTAQAQVTATAQYAATATAVVNNYPFSNILKLDDPLKDNSKGIGWQTTSRTCSFTNGEYHVTGPTTDGYYICSALKTNYSDFTYQVTMKYIKGQVGGITFRSDDATGKSYKFVVADDSSVALYVYKDNNKGTELFGGNAAGWKKGQENQVGVVARGSSISLYVNGEKVGSVTDDTHKSGQIGMVVYNVKEIVELVVKDVKVWVL